MQVILRTLTYYLAQENCWFFCRAVEDMLSWGDNVVMQRGRIKHTELARNVRSRIMRQIKRIHNIAEPFTVSVIVLYKLHQVAVIFCTRIRSQNSCCQSVVHTMSEPS